MDERLMREWKHREERMKDKGGASWSRTHVRSRSWQKQWEKDTDRSQRSIQAQPSPSSQRRRYSDIKGANPESRKDKQTVEKKQQGVSKRGCIMCVCERREGETLKRKEGKGRLWKGIGWKEGRWGCVQPMLSVKVQGNRKMAEREQIL